MSFDEVHAYLEGDEQVYAVEIPAELYQWAEAFILSHYAATKKVKRKLKYWMQGSGASWLRMTREACCGVGENAKHKISMIETRNRQ